MSRSLSLFLSQLVLSLPILAGISGEIPVATPSYSNAPGEQTNARVAFDGDHFLAAWIDHRDEAENLYAARFDAAGTVLDPTNIRIALPHGEGRIINGVLPMNGTWLVIWSEQDFRSDTPVPQSNVMAARIDRDGYLIETPRSVIPNAYAVTSRSAATNGSRILVVYADKYALLDTNAQILRRDLQLPARAAAVASNGSGFMIEAGNMFVSVNSNGDITAAAALLSPNDLPLGLASDGANYFAVTHTVNNVVFDVHVIGPTAQQLVKPVPVVSGIPTSGDVIWNGTAYVFAVWTSIETAAGAYQQLQALRFDRNGDAIDSGPFAISEHATGSGNGQASIASNGSEIISVWHTLSETSADDAYATIVNASLQRSTPILLSQSANLQVNPTLAFSGRNFLSVWQETTGTYFGRIGINGEQLDGRGIRITPAGYNPKVIFDGSNYLVSWLTAGTNLAILWVTRVTPDGQVLDGDGVEAASSTCVFNFDIVGGSDRTLVSWDECGYHALRALQLDRTAQPIGAAVVITPQSMRTALPAIAWNGSEYLVAFQEQISVPPAHCGPAICESFRSNIRAVRLSPQMTVLDTEPLAVAVSDSEDQKTPLVASDGTNFLVGWTANGIRTRDVLADGNLGATMSVGDGTLSSLIFDGSRYAAGFGSNGDALVTHPGAGDRAIVSATTDVESAPWLVSADGRNIVAAYVRTATGPLYGGVPRVFLREVNTEPRGRAVRAR